MTLEELLRRRYKVENLYPECPYQVDDILYEAEKSFLDNYPYLFRRLHWFEEREIQDMPQYISIDSKVWKIKEWRKDIIGHWYPMNEVDAKSDSENFSNISWHFRSTHSKPATEEEYNSYINK